MADERFIGRRGLPAEICSDNGTNFVDANNKLKELYKFFNQSADEIVLLYIQKDVLRHLTPPPLIVLLLEDYGRLGLNQLKNVYLELLAIAIGDILQTYEQYKTLLIMIEACLNSRPLCLESSDPNDTNALTPGHFLIGGPITGLLNIDLSNVPINRLKHWQLVTHQMQNFWKRWSGLENIYTDYNNDINGKL